MLLAHLPIISRFMRQRDELKRCQMELKALCGEMDHLVVTEKSYDFQYFSGFCRRHGITSRTENYENCIRKILRIIKFLSSNVKYPRCRILE